MLTGVSPQVALPCGIKKLLIEVGCPLQPSAPVSLRVIMWNLYSLVSTHGRHDLQAALASLTGTSFLGEALMLHQRMGAPRAAAG